MNRQRSSLRLVLAATGAVLLAASVAVGQTYSESEPNQSLATATPVPPSPAGIGLQPGETIGGASTGSSTTAASPANTDYFRIRVSSASLGIYKQTLSVNNGTSPLPHTVTLRGFSQAGSGIDPTTDATLQTASSAASKVVQWYGFGKGEEVYLKIDGTSSSTAPYTVTLDRTSVTALPTATTFTAGPITVTTIGQGHTSDTDFWVYNANLEPVPTFGNDNNTTLGGGTSSGNLSIATRSLPPGVYYVAISNANLANDQPNPPDERNLGGAVSPFPNAIINTSTSTNVNVKFAISDAAGHTEAVTATKAAAFEVVWATFTVGASSGLRVSPAVSPNPLTPGVSTATFTLGVTPAVAPPNTITTATLDLTAIGGPAAQTLYDDGATGGDTAVDGTYTFAYAVPVGIFASEVMVPYTVMDNGGHTVTGRLFLNVTPSNDDCANATVITDAQMPLSQTVNISHARPDSASSCSATTANGIWYTYTPSADRILSAWETGSRSTDVVFYQGADCNNLTELLCENTEDDANLPVQAGQKYYIFVYTPGSTSSASTTPTDTFVMQFKTPTVSTPANSLCSMASVLVPSASMQSFPGGNTPPGPRSQCQTLSNQPNEARNAIWFTYTTPANSDQLVRYQRANNPIFFSLQFFTGDCNNLTPYECANLGFVDAFTRLHKNTTYYIMAHKRSGYMAADANYQFIFDVTTPAQCANPDCGTAKPILALPYTDTVNNIFAFDEASTSNCEGNTAANGSGVWYSFSPAQPTVVNVTETTAQAAAISVFEGSCSGTRLVCSVLDTDTTGFNRFHAYPGITYYILVARRDTGLPAATDTFSISVTGTTGTVPANDICSTATAITSFPFNDSVNVGLASDDTPRAVCSRGTITNTTRAGIWYTYTNGPTAMGAVFTETSALDTIVAAYTGDCGFLTPVMCSDEPETNMYLWMQANTTYHLLLAKASDTPTASTDFITFSMSVSPSQIPPPVNQDCGHAQPIASFPFNYTSVPLAALPGPGPSCLYNPASLLVVQATNPIWYAFDTGALGFTLQVYQTVTGDEVAYTLFQSCGQPFEDFCDSSGSNGTAASPRSFILNSNTRYYLQVSRRRNYDYSLSAANYNLVVTAAPGTQGACCTGTTCGVAVLGSCSGSFLPGFTCDATNPCLPPTVTCCRGTTCLSVSSGSCTGVVAGSISTIIAPPNTCTGTSIPSCCYADYDHNGAKDIDDIFTYLNAWFARSPYATVGGDGTAMPVIDDIFAFLNYWFAGCH